VLQINKQKTVYSLSLDTSTSYEQI